MPESQKMGDRQQQKCYIHQLTRTSNPKLFRALGNTALKCLIEVMNNYQMQVRAESRLYNAIRKLNSKASPNPRNKTDNPTWAFVSIGQLESSGGALDHWYKDPSWAGVISSNWAEFESDVEMTSLAISTSWPVIGLCLRDIPEINSTKKDQLLLLGVVFLIWNDSRHRTRPLSVWEH